MKAVLSALAAAMFTYACSDAQLDQNQTEAETPMPAGPATQAQDVQATKAQLGTPASLAGGKPLASPNPHSRLTPEQHIDVALQHAQEGRLEEALDVLELAIRDTPEHAGLLGARGSLKLSLDQAADALADLEQAVSLAPQSALLLVNRSQAYRKFNRLDEALADLENAVELSPKLIPARFNRGVLYYGRTEYEKALADFDLCIELDEKTPGPYFNRAITRDAMGDADGAVSDLNRFVALADNEEWRQAAVDTLQVIEKREAERDLKQEYSNGVGCETIRSIPQRLKMNDSFKLSGILSSRFTCC